MRNKLMSTSLLTATLLALLFVAAGQTSAQEFQRISELSIEADRPDYVGSCPRNIHLTGKFKVNEAGLGVASVQFVHSHGSAQEPRSLTVNDKRVYTFEVDLRQTNSWSDLVFLRVTVSPPTGPQRFDSSQILIKGDCRRQELPEVGPFSPLPATGTFRVTLTGFRVNHETLESPISTDGAGDEVFALVNSADLGPSGNISAPLETRMSVRYGDTSGIGPNTLPGIFQGGEASRTGGFRTGNTYPPLVGQPVTPSWINAGTRARLIPMILWQGEFRRGENPNAAVIIPTIWENDNTPDVLNEWNLQVDRYLRILAISSSAVVNNRVRLPLVLQRDIVLNTVPQHSDFDHPIGIQGDTFDPLSPTHLPATFIPAVMILTYNSAEQAASAGVVEITYRDGHNYGDGSYTIFLLIERIP